MALHVYAAASKHHPFGFETEPLFDGGVAAQFDFSSRAKYALPGESERGAQNSNHLTGCSGVAGGAGHGAVGGDFAARDFADGGDNAGLQVGGSHNAIHPARISHSEATETKSQSVTPCKSGR
ncbi:hypothetical protein SBA7_120047 [Candidatus Sulfotelmatobacter sp. SbA7]|nr:hypothetical protein SBA7_120047 [Candidatus Sulfotelmatobacter sp. SbA7]